MDGDNEEDRLGTAPLPPSSGPYHHHHHHHHYNHNHNHHHDDHDHNHDRHHQPQQRTNDPRQRQHHYYANNPDTYAYYRDDILSTTSHNFIDPAAATAAAAAAAHIDTPTYAAANLQAVAANAATAAAYPDPELSDHTSSLESPIEPDDFYRDHRGQRPAAMASATLPKQSQPQQAQNQHQHQHQQQPPPQPQSSGASRIDQHAAPPILSNSSTPRRQPTGHAGLRSAHRSASMPVNDPSSRPAGSYGPTKQPSVKDLKKHFDQAVAGSPQTSSHTSRQQTSRHTSRDSTSSATYGRSVAATGQPPSYLSLRTSVDRKAGEVSATRSTQRPRYAEEDQLSNNSKSFASRMRPKAASTATAAATTTTTTTTTTSTTTNNPMSHSMPKAGSPRPLRSPSVPATSPRLAQPSGLLFGEILPHDDGSHTAGYGIEETRPRQRRISESRVHDLGTLHRNQHDHVDPASPTDWYRTSASIRAPTKESRIPATTKPSHNRTQSDISGTKISASVARRPPSRQARSSMSSQPPSPSRLPVSVKKHGDSSGPSSPSTRANSPAQAHPPSGRTSRQLAMRAKTPTTRSTTPTTKTPRQQSATASRKPAPSKITTPSSHGNTRLAAYISAPPPKLSPPLRSSRPRQPVSSASTASSRLKAVDRSSNSKSGGKDDEPTSRRRKIDVGPIDFAQRRETIKLAYSKSIRESQAREARQAAAAKRKAQMEAAAKAKAEAEAALAIQLEKAAAQAAQPPVSSPANAEAPAEENQAASAARYPSSDPPSSAVASPEMSESAAITKAKLGPDFPTLEIPGSFPSFGSPEVPQEDVPASAISNMSVVTEFDDEPQVEPAAPLARPSGLEIHVPSDSPATVYEKAMYQSPFDEDRIGEMVIPGVSRDQSHEFPDPTVDEPPRGTDYGVTAESEPDQGRTTQASEESQEMHELDQNQEAHAELEDVDVGLHQKPAEEQTHPASLRPYVEEEEYEPTPFVPQSHQTTVTILSRGSTDFVPPATVGRADYIREATTPQSPQMDSLEDFYISGPHLRDNISALRDSTFMSSEASDEQMASSAEAQRTPDTSRSLTIPGILSPANRASQHSVWTDFSLDSSDGGRDRTTKSGLPLASRDSTLRGRPPMLDSRPVSFSSDRRGEDHGYGSDFSRPDVYDVIPSHLETHKLPELDTGDGFSMDYVSTSIHHQPVPDRPDHDPPPLPSLDDRSSREGRRTSSGGGYHDQTRPSSYFQSVKDDESNGPSRRESSDFTQPLYDSHSAGHMSVNSADPRLSRSSTADAADQHRMAVADEPKDLPGLHPGGTNDKERNRLIQRQNVIKELIDTEGSFVRDMNVIEEIYKGTAEACPKLDGKTIKLIFRNTDEIIAFHTSFHADLKEAVAPVYSPKGRRSPLARDGKEDPAASESVAASSNGSFSKDGRDMTMEPDDGKDRQTSIGPVFAKGIEQMRAVHESFLRTSDPAAKRLIQIQEDPAVQVWLSECNEAARDLTAAWNLDSLLIKPMQRITKYPNLISQLLQYTPEDHPDREALVAARNSLETAILEINKTKKNFELVGQIVGRKRKDSDVRAGFARAFGKRVDKLQAATVRIEEDVEYKTLHEKFGDDYLRLQVVLRDVEFYTRKVSEYVHEFLQYLSAMELVMRLQPSPFPEIESKWSRFNVSMRDMEKVALDQHLAQVRKHVIEPFELVIRCYNHPSLAMKKRAKRRLDFERAEQLKKAGKKVDKQLAELVEQYEALNETLKKELPKLSAHTEKIGNICLGNFVCIQVKWFSIWKDKVKAVLDDKHVPEMPEVVSSFQREFKMMEEQIGSIGILNPSLKPRTSQSTTDESSMRSARPRPSELSSRSRGQSINDAPSLPTPDFGRSNSAHVANSSPTVTSPMSSSHQYYYKDQYPGYGGSSRYVMPASPVHSSGLPGSAPGRPHTGRSYDSAPSHRPSVESQAQSMGAHYRRDSGSTYASNYPPPEQRDRRFSGLFSSAMPPDEPEERHHHHQRPLPVSQRPSRASSRERPMINGYNVMFLAASLFEFNIEDTKHEAGYPYLTYPAGEIFDVIAEKGELWLAKNQDDPDKVVGWIWSKHFAKLAEP